jgi:aspartyl-tRNA(Asn)/glutamyl-tRNA(Gln) amidotransferase subunit A
MTRTVEDAALMLTVLSRPDARDWHALPSDGRDYRIGLDGGIAGLRIAASTDLGFVEVDEEVAAAFAAALAVLADLGAQVELVDPPIGRPGSIFARTWFPAATRLLEKLPPEQRPRLDPGFVAMAEQGARYSRAEIQDAMLERGELGVAMQAFLSDYDLLVTPSTALPAFGAGVEYPDPGRPERWSEWATFSYPFNLTQQPAISVPCGFTAAGLPIGLQLVAAKYADALVLRAARAFEAARPQPMPQAPRGAPV